MAKTDRVRDALSDVAAAPTLLGAEVSREGPLVPLLIRVPADVKAELARRFAREGLSTSAGLRRLVFRFLDGKI